MNKLSIAFLCVFLLTSMPTLADADCRGCCSRNGGVKCVNGVTVCVDGTPLSQRCIDKGCNVCDDQTATPAPTSQTISIASFNIQVFGRTKAGIIEVMEVLAKTISRYDLVAIQEVRDSSGTAIRRLETAVDNLGVNYEYIIGPRLGRTSSKEQYAFFYRSGTVAVNGAYTYHDTGDVFHREPFIGHFKSTGGNFDLVLINIHTDPDDAKREIYALDQAVADARSHFSEPDIIVLGDFNADGRYFNENDRRCPLRKEEYTWLIGNDLDTTIAAGDNTYDRIVITSAAQEDYEGTAGVFRFDLNFELDCEPKDVSDHYPVFAVFQVASDTD